MKGQGSGAQAKILALFEYLTAESAAVKYGSAKALRQMSEESPELLYPRFDDFVRLFRGDNTILRWGATLILGNLAGADHLNKFEKIFKRFFAPITGHELIGAANVIRAAVQVALAKPHLADRSAGEILKVEEASYRTLECRNVAISRAIESLDEFFPHIKNRRPVLEFAARQLDNQRPAVRRKAERFLKRHAAA